jgi:hypothetical protein
MAIANLLTQAVNVLLAFFMLAQAITPGHGKPIAALQWRVVSHEFRVKAKADSAELCQLWILLFRSDQHDQGRATSTNNLSRKSVVWKTCSRDLPCKPLPPFQFAYGKLEPVGWIRPFNI